MRRRHRLEQFWKIKLPLILPSIGIISILTFVGNFNAFDLIYTAQGALAGPDYPPTSSAPSSIAPSSASSCRSAIPTMGATIATVMFLIILAGVSLYLFLIQTRASAATSSEAGGLHVAKPRLLRGPQGRGGSGFVHLALGGLPIGAARAVPDLPGRRQLVQVARRHLFRAAALAERYDLRPDRLQTVMAQGDFLHYFQNSLDRHRRCRCFFVLLFGAMAAFALSEYRFRGNTMMGLYLALGIMIPIRLGTVAILQLMVATGLVNTLTALILVYTAQGLPLAVFILSEFMKQVSDDLKNAGRIDGLSRIHDLLPPGAAAGPAGDGDGRRLHHDPDLERSVVPADPGAERKRPRP
jgi:ABC-type glycerol-3-phosphate transport system permease component